MLFFAPYIQPFAVLLQIFPAFFFPFGYLYLFLSTHYSPLNLRCNFLAGLLHTLLYAWTLVCISGFTSQSNVLVPYVEDRPRQKYFLPE